MNRVKEYKARSNYYWDSEYKKLNWKVTHNAGSKEKTVNLANREIDLFLDPTKKKIEDLLKDEENNPYPTFTEDFINHSPISDFIEDFSEATVLDYGCGSLARYSIELGKRFKYVYGVDISGEAIKLAKGEVKKSGLKNVALMKNNGSSIPLPSNFVDFVFSNLVLQHIGNIEINYMLAKEFMRILKPGGVIRVEYLDGSQRKKDSFESVAEGNGVTERDLQRMYEENGGKIKSVSEGHPWLWVTVIKE